MTATRVPKIDYPKKGDLSVYITSSKVIRNIKKLSRQVVIKCFSPREKLTSESYEDYLCLLHGKILHSNIEDIEKASKLDGIQLAEFVRDLKTARY